MIFPLSIKCDYLRCAMEHLLEMKGRVLFDNSIVGSNAHQIPSFFSCVALRLHHLKPSWVFLKIRYTNDTIIIRRDNRVKFQWNYDKLYEKHDYLGSELEHLLHMKVCHFSHDFFL